MKDDPDYINPADLFWYSRRFQPTIICEDPHSIDLVTTRQLVYSTQTDGQAGNRYTPDLINNWVILPTNDDISLIIIGMIGDDIGNISGSTAASIYQFKYLNTDSLNTQPIGFVVVNHSIEESLFFTTTAPGNTPPLDNGPAALPDDSNTQLGDTAFQGMKSLLPQISMGK